MFPAHPSLDSFTENVNRAHLQACLEKQATKSEPREMNHAKYRWEEHEATKSLIPVMLPKMSNLFNVARRQVVKSGPAKVQRHKR